MDDYIIRLTNEDTFDPTRWHMTLDLRTIRDCAGKKCQDKYNGGSFVDIPLPRAKKLLKLIVQYGKEEDFVKCDHYFKGNERLYKFWKSIRPEEGENARRGFKDA